MTQLYQVNHRIFYGGALPNVLVDIVMSYAYKQCPYYKINPCCKGSILLEFFDEGRTEQFELWCSNECREYYIADKILVKFEIYDGNFDIRFLMHDITIYKHMKIFEEYFTFTERAENVKEEYNGEDRSENTRVEFCMGGVNCFIYDVIAEPNIEVKIDCAYCMGNCCYKEKLCNCNYEVCNNCVYYNNFLCYYHDNEYRNYYFPKVYEKLMRRYERRENPVCTHTCTCRLEPCGRSELNILYNKKDRSLRNEGMGYLYKNKSKIIVKDYIDDNYLRELATKNIDNWIYT